MQSKIILILDNIRSVHNVGSLFRSAECFGVTEILLCGTTPAPVDRFGRARPDMAKVALGAECLIPWEYFETTGGATEYIRVKFPNTHIIGLEQDPRAKEFPIKERVSAKYIAIIVGEETKGLTEEIKLLCDELWEIPQWGAKESLNVSNAGAVALYELRRIMLE